MYTTNYVVQNAPQVLPYLNANNLIPISNALLKY